MCCGLVTSHLASSFMSPGPTEDPYCQLKTDWSGPHRVGQQENWQFNRLVEKWSTPVTLQRDQLTWGQISQVQRGFSYPQNACDEIMMPFGYSGFVENLCSQCFFFFPTCSSYCGSLASVSWWTGAGRLSKIQSHSIDMNGFCYFGRLWKLAHMRLQNSLEFSIFMPQLSGTVRSCFCLQLLIAKLEATLNKLGTWLGRTFSWHWR